MLQRVQTNIGHYSLQLLLECSSRRKRENSRSSKSERLPKYNYVLEEQLSADNSMGKMFNVYCNFWVHFSLNCVDRSIFIDAIIEITIMPSFDVLSYFHG
jgi:hypothetical protein